MEEGKAKRLDSFLMTVHFSFLETHNELFLNFLGSLEVDSQGRGRSHCRLSHFAVGIPCESVSERKNFLPPFYNRAKPSQGLIGERCPPASVRDRIWDGKRLHPKHPNLRGRESRRTHGKPLLRQLKQTLPCFIIVF